MTVNILPIVKKKGLDAKDSQNYRPIALATAASKILEHALFEKISTYLGVGKHQFGYKHGHGTELAVFTLKSIVNVYKEQGSSVLATFMNASKAFDCVLHAKLCTKLLDRGMNASIVKLLYIWCKTQKFQIVWNGRLSRSFMIEKSVRQGGVLSPCLFNVYMDSLGLMLTDLGVGCRIGRRFSNNLWYADDLVLLAPTVAALQKLIDVCHNYASEHNIIFNEKKTVCMRFGTTSAKIKHFPIISINSNN